MSIFSSPCSILRVQCLATPSTYLFGLNTSQNIAWVLCRADGPTSSQGWWKPGGEASPPTPAHEDRTDREIHASPGALEKTVL